MRRFAAALALAVAVSHGLAAEPLKSPVDVEARRALIGKPQSRFTCPSTPAPVSDVLAEPFYSDRAGSIVDPARYAARVEAVKPLSQFIDAVTRGADRWLISQPAQPEAARCALAILDAWASAGAMLGRVTSQGGYERKWVLAGAALAYLRLRNVPHLDPEEAARVEAWLGRLGHAVKAYYDRPPGRGLSDKINNHLYWAALATAASAIASNDYALFDWAMAKGRFAMTQIEPDGTLPLEVMRAGKALHYHIFSVTPLVVLAEIAAANRVDLYGEGDAALRRLVRRVVTDLDDARHMVGLTGVSQDFVGSLSGWNFAWAEIWYARFGDPEMLPLLRRYRPARNSWLGGDMTAAFGVPELPR